MKTFDRPKSADVRNRLFLVVESFASPAPHARTERAGWMTIPEHITSTEHPRIVARITSNHLSRADIIIDLFRDHLIKNRLGGGVAETLRHFKAKYADLIRQTMDRLSLSRL